MAHDPIIIANWKMYKTESEAIHFVQELKKIYTPGRPRVWIAPSFTVLPGLSRHAVPFTCGAQTVHQAEEGAFTGEVSARMVKDAGAHFVLIGHSERRRLFHETLDQVHLKLQRALETGLLPVLCIGETEEERKQGQTRQVLISQLKTALKDLTAPAIVIAYEPVWAIGTGRAADPNLIEEVHQECFRILAELGGQEWAKRIPLLYGGSVTPGNAGELVKCPHVNGVLVGGASLDPHKFNQIIRCFA